MKRNIKNMLLPMHIPGILIQLLLIPSVMVALNWTGLVRFHRVQPSTVPVEHFR